MFDVGVNYLNKFGDVTVALYGAFMYASFIPGNQPFGSQNYANGANLTSWKQWVVGAQVGYAGFTLGGAIGYDNNGLGSNYYTGVDNDTRFYTAGVMYETGPWQMSFNWVGSFNTNGNGSASVSSIAPGTSAQSTFTNTGVPGINATAFNQNSAWRPALRARVGPEVRTRYQLRARTGREADRWWSVLRRFGSLECRLRQLLGHPGRYGSALLVASPTDKVGKSGRKPALFFVYPLDPFHLDGEAAQDLRATMFTNRVGR